MGELDHGSLSVVGRKVFATKYANYFDVRRPGILASFAPILHPRELVLDLISKHDPLYLLCIVRIMPFGWIISVLQPHFIGKKLTPFVSVNHQSSGVLGTYFYRSG